jgi:Arc/MetJ-type ribon-helix-helix transcriptional regulator
MPTVEVVVPQSQKDDWRAFVEELDEGKQYDSVSDLVRTAVEQQMSRDLGQEGVPDEVEDMMYDILDEFSSLQAKLGMANEALDTIQNKQLDEETVEEVVGFHRELIEDELDNINHPAAEEMDRDDA